MEMKTLLAILYANDMENVVSRAIAIDNSLVIQTDKKVIRLNVSKSNLPVGKQFGVKAESYGNVDCPIIGYNQLKLSREYLVQYPNGSTEWVSLGDDRTSNLTEIIDIPVKEEVLVD